MINAAYGFTSILLRVFKELRPDYWAVTFDLTGPTSIWFFSAIFMAGSIACMLLVKPKAASLESLVETLRRAA